MKKYTVHIISVSLVIIVALSFIMLKKSEENEKKIIFDEDFNNINIVISDDLTFDYYEKVSIDEIVSLETGDLILEDLDTYQLGDKTLDFYYKIDDNIYKGTFNYSVIDNESPIILNSSSYTIKTGGSIDFLATIFVADNYDKKASCEILGEYDFDEAGTYPLSIDCYDSSDNLTSKDFNLYVKDEINSSSTYEVTPILFEDIIEKHKTDETRIGIDVSHWQGDIDWDIVKDAGCEFAFIRAGYAPGNDIDFFLDTKFLQNLENARNAGMDIGLYYFSYATTVEEVIDHADYIINLLDGTSLELPISFDWEMWSKWNTYNLSTTDLNNMALAFIDRVEDAGYKGINYGSAYYLRNIWNIDVPTWLAHYTEQTSYEKDYYIWQLTDSGVIDGIDGYVDINVMYKK